ncbi:hypothetical protein LC040_03570 [Bacillus tianshenii]|nr:hypothetical protein LC040_03570 [Bacillus tianshenii]
MGEANYTLIETRLIQDTELSWKAKGILVYLLGKVHSDDIVTLDDLLAQASDTKESLFEGIQELQEKGYLQQSILEQLA